MIKHTGEVSVSLHFKVEAGNDSTDDMRRTYRPKRVTVTISTYVHVSIEAVKIKKDGTDSAVTLDPYHARDNYPPFVLAAIKATQAYILKAQEANRG